MIDKEYPEPIVGAVIINKRQEVLVLKSHKWFGKYVIPGGHVEVGETLKDALKREVKEETGLEVSDIQFLHLQEFIFDSLYWKKKHFIFLNFSCFSDSDNIKLNDESQEYIWVPLSDLESFDVEPHSKQAIHAYRHLKNYETES